MRALRLALFTTIPTMLAVAEAGAQQFPSLGGAELRFSLVTPEKADLGFGGSAQLDLGYLQMPWIRTLFGVDYFGAGLDRRVNGVAVGGTFSAIGAHAGVRIDPLGASRLAPFGLLTLSARNARTSGVTDPTTRDLLQGFYIGAGVGAGFALAIDTSHHTMITVQAERFAITNIGHWAVTAGLRFMPSGRRAYDRAAATVIAGSMTDAERRLRDSITIAEGERRLRDSLRVAGSARLRDSLVTQSRTESERLRATQDSLARVAEQRAADQRAADQRAAEARVTAEARATAEAEAARERARADSLANAARDAERRAAEAETRAYDAVRNLQRLVSNITDVRETERGLTLVLGQGLFPTGSVALSADAARQVATIAAVLAQYPQRTIRVEGHTDATGSTVTNQRLSEQRAEAVRAALIANGVDPTRVESTGYGTSRPIADNATAAGRAANRRVEVILVGARRPGTPPGE
jgi:outer membrane protein OmpA-like peptidoglycan-associated protein